MLSPSIENSEKRGSIVATQVSERSSNLRGVRKRGLLKNRKQVYLSTDNDSWCRLKCLNKFPDRLRGVARLVVDRYKHDFQTAR